MNIGGYEIIEDINKFPFHKLELGFVSNGKRGKGKRYYYKNIVALDTETCTYNDVAFISDISITIEGLATYYCHAIPELFLFLDRLQNYFNDDDRKRMIIYVHNLSYDYVFLRNALFKHYGFPINSLAVKSHKYVTMDFGFYEFRDSLILTQKSLDKLATDEKVEVQKAVGYWDYTKIRSPHSARTEKEKIYANADTIALCLALRSVMNNRNVNTGSCPLTSTGFIRNESRKRSRIIREGKKWRNKFKELKLSYDDYTFLERVFHGGYTHANRFYINQVLYNLKSFDFTSSYPSVMLYEKFPMEKFTRAEYTIEQIIDLSKDFAFFGDLLMENVILKKNVPMPPMAKAKCTVIDERKNKAVVDNGRIVRADAVIIPFSDPDLDLYLKYYDYDYADVKNVRAAKKDYLPDWFAEYVHELFYNKCTLKDTDKINYSISKSYINAMYGMIAQKILREINEEDYDKCEWSHSIQNEEDFDKYYSNPSSFLPYQWAIWVTAYAQHNLFELGSCCKHWIYSDTDSCKGFGWNFEKVKKYNKKIEEKAIKRGYGIVNYNGMKYVIGQADDETNDYLITEFITLGCKRYCYRQTEKKKDGTIIPDVLHLTVAGVPKDAVTELKNDIDNFGKGFIFHSVINDMKDYKGSNKRRPEYHINNDDNYITVLGETVKYGSYIILKPVDYILDQTVQFDEETGLPFKYDFTDISTR